MQNFENRLFRSRKTNNKMSLSSHTFASGIHICILGNFELKKNKKKTNCSSARATKKQKTKQNEICKTGGMNTCMTVVDD